MGCKSSRNAIPPINPTQDSPSEKDKESNNRRSALTSPNLSQSHLSPTDLKVDVPDSLMTLFKVEGPLYESNDKSLLLISTQKGDYLRAVAEITPKKCFDSTSMTEIDYFDRINILRELQHPFLPQVYHMFENTLCYELVLEFSQGQRLDSFLRRTPFIDFENLLSIIIATMKTIEYLHMHEIVHQNLKVKNIFVSPTNPKDIKVLGLSTVQKIDKNATLEVVSNVIRFKKPLDSFCAPELKQCNCKPDFSIDMFALGVIIHYLISGKFPQNDKMCEDTIWENQAILRYGFKELILKLMSADPKMRPDIQTVLNHHNPFLTERVEKASASIVFDQDEGEED